MLFAFSEFEESLYVVVGQFRPISHVNWLDFESSCVGLLAIDESGPQEIVKRIPEGCSLGSAFAFDSKDNIFIERYRCSDAHDVLRVASKSSNRKVVRRFHT